MTDIRDKLLEAAITVFAQQGYLGCTTRRVAQEAGVNEVTLFRHFGSKDVLIREALAHVERGVTGELPAEPKHPEAELRAWARRVYASLREQRLLIRRVLGDTVEHPEIAPVVCDGAETQHTALARYLAALRDRGLAGADFDPEGVTAMLLGALFADAMMRDMMPARLSVDAMLDAFVRSTLAATGTVLTPRTRVA